MPISTPHRAALRRSLLRWYDAHRRDLPWRQTRDPYAIWVAEIMLQQTRVAAVLEHYREFLRRFPSVERLARAPGSAVLAAWSGLGYYRRARALHAAARVVLRKFGGRLPRTEAELAQLPGVGRYTAAAIASTAFGRPCAVVDGNVERVLTRLLGLVRPPSAGRLWDLAAQLLSRRRPGDFNQAMMELGATVCVPSAPHCDLCPVRRRCAWSISASETPTHRENQSQRRKKEVTYTLAESSGGVFLVQRAMTSSLMPGMWELPQVTAGPAYAGAALLLRHAITTTDYRVTVVRGPAPAGENGRWMRVSRLRQLPLTGLARKILHRASLL